MYDILQLNDMLVPELLDIAEQLKIPNAKKLDKQELVYKILDKQAVMASAGAAKNGAADDKGKRKRVVKTTTANATEEADVVSGDDKPVRKELKKEAPKKPAVKSAILHPEMTVSTGTWDKPAMTIGTKPAEPWTSTTVAAGVDSKPQPGKAITVVGEIVDFSCYLQLGKHGEKHRACGQKCATAGQPIGLLTKAGALYMIMPEEHDPRRDGGVDSKVFGAEHMGHIVEVSGTAADVGGYHGIFVQGLTK